MLAPFAKGEFGFIMNVNVNADIVAQSGIDTNKANIYYISDSGEISKLNSVIKNSDGSVSVAVSHASQYVVSAAAPVNVLGVSGTGTVNTGKSGSNNSGGINYGNGSKSAAPYTAVDSSKFLFILQIVIAFFVSMIVACAVCYKKRCMAGIMQHNMIASIKEQMRMCD